MEEAGQSQDVNDRIEHLKVAAKRFGESKERVFEAKVSHSYLFLIKAITNSITADG